MSSKLSFIPYGSKGLIVKFDKPSVYQIEILSRSIFRDQIAIKLKKIVQDLLLTSDSLTIFFNEPTSLDSIKEKLLKTYDMSVSKRIDLQYKHW